MSDFPHIYTTTAQATNEVLLALSADKLHTLDVSPPKEFGGPAGYWNPEALFSAAISSCFILTFKSIARAKKLTWSKINVDADAYLDKEQNQLSFKRVDIFVTLTIAASLAAELNTYQQALERAEASCLITNSIKSEVHLYPKIELV